MNEWDGAQWRKASESNDIGCAEVAFRDGKVGIQDTKDRSKPPHLFTEHEWRCFIAGAKKGEFDPP